MCVGSAGFRACDAGAAVFHQQRRRTWRDAASAPTRGAAAPRVADSRYRLLLAYLSEDDPDPAKRKYEAFLVTAKHVVRDFILNNRALSARVNPKDASSQSRQFEITNEPQLGSGTWFCHPDPKVDIAAVRVNFDYL